MPRAQLIFLGRFARAHQIPQRFMLRIRHPHRRQLAGAIIPRQLQRIPTVRLHTISSFHRHQRRRYHGARRSHLRQLPIQHIPGRTCFLTESQLLHRSQFLDQLPNRLLSIRNHSQGPYFPILLRYRYGDHLNSVVLETDGREVELAAIQETELAKVEAAFGTTAA